MNTMVNNKLQELLDVFKGSSSCKIEPNRGDRLLIASKKSVPWAAEFKKQYGEFDNKIGYISPKKTCLALYIDFPKNLLTLDEVSNIVNPNNSLLYVPSGQHAPKNLSWWRFRTAGFDSIDMVIRKNELQSYNFHRNEFIELVRTIVDVHK